MSRINVCAGCQARDNGVKSRIAIPHTCGKSWGIDTTPKTMADYKRIQLAQKLSETPTLKGVDEQQGTKFKI